MYFWEWSNQSIKEWITECFESFSLWNVRKQSLHLTHVWKSLFPELLPTCSVCLFGLVQTQRRSIHNHVTQLYDLSMIKDVVDVLLALNWISSQTLSWWSAHISAALLYNNTTQWYLSDGEKADSITDGQFGEGRSAGRADHRHRLLLNPRQLLPKVRIQTEPRGEAEQTLLLHWQYIFIRSIWLHVGVKCELLSGPCLALKVGTMGSRDREQSGAALLSDMENIPLTSHSVSG